MHSKTNSEVCKPNQNAQLFWPIDVFFEEPLKWITDLFLQEDERGFIEVGC